MWCHVHSFANSVTNVHYTHVYLKLQDSLHLFSNLTALYLYENNITEIEGLQRAESLELLYLQKNKLDRINGLLKCKKLRKLWVQADAHLHR